MFLHFLDCWVWYKLPPFLIRDGRSFEKATTKPWVRYKKHRCKHKLLKVKCPQIKRLSLKHI